MPPGKTWEFSLKKAVDFCRRPFSDQTVRNVCDPIIFGMLQFIVMQKSGEFLQNLYNSRDLASWYRKRRLKSIFQAAFGGEGAKDGERSIFDGIIAMNPVLLWASMAEMKRITAEVGKIGGLAAISELSF